MGYFNYHTHTRFCDGKNTPQEMVEAAIELGFDTLGFSGHAMAPEAEEYGVKDLKGYIESVNRLKDKYSDRITILCGIERDIFSYEDNNDYDYIIGAVHSLRRGNKYYSVDMSPQSFKTAIDELYGGDGEAFAVEYMNLVKDVARITDCDIIAHFDLVSKFNGDGENLFFNTCAESYLSAAKAAIEENVKYCNLFELNTGAISRGWRKTPYPTPEMLDMIRAAGGRITFGADTHSAQTIFCGHDEGEALIRARGFDGYTRLVLK